MSVFDVFIDFMRADRRRLAEEGGLATPCS
jgi:hypothetical protein